MAIIEIKSNTELERNINAITSKKFVAIDTETTGLDCFVDDLVLFQIGDEEDMFVIHCHLGVSLEPLKSYLEESNAVKCFHNHKFDYKMILKHAGIRVDKNIYDTMLSEIVLRGGTAYMRSKKMRWALGALVQRYLNIDVDKTIRLNFVGQKKPYAVTEEMIKYSAEDVMYTCIIAKKQIPLLKKEGLFFTADLEAKASCAVANMEYTGVYLSKKRWLSVANEAKNRLDRYTTELNNHFKDVANLDIFGQPLVNYSSHAQLLDLFQQLGVKLESTERSVLLQNKHIPVVETLINYREYEKALSTYGENFLRHVHKKTGRVHPNFNMMVATGRLSCDDPNLQNIKAPRSADDLNYRNAFVSQTNGDEILTADYSGCELRILAQLSRDPVLLDAFQSEYITNEEADIHSQVASLMFGKPVSKKNHPELRDKAKTINFGLIYGMGVGSLAIRLGVSRSKSKELVGQYFQTMPDVDKYLEASVAFAQNNGYSKTIGGRIRKYHVPDLHTFINTYKIKKEDYRQFSRCKTDEDVKVQKHRAILASIKNQAKNTPIQGTNGDIIKLALWKIYNFLKDKNPKLVNTVHDEVVIEGKDLKNIEGDVIALMEDAEAYFLKDIPPRVSSVIKESWSK